MSTSFSKAKKHNDDQAKTAMHLLHKEFEVPLDLQLKRFEHTTFSIALYGCEIWVYENANMIEKLQNKLLTYITNS